MKLAELREQHRQRRPQLPSAEAVNLMSREWFATPLGRAVLRSEKALVEPVLSRTFGYHILQVGCSEDHSLIEASPISHKIIFAPNYQEGGQHAVADNEALPLETDSIDVALIHHALDFTQDCHRLLREVSRVLRPGGKLLIIGFNPFSSWGLWRLFKRRNSIPWQGRFIASRRVSDWLKLLELRQDGVEFGLHFLPVRLRRLLSFSSRLEQWGNRFNSPMGGAYVILCTNQVVPLTPIMPRWRPLRARASAIPATENIRVRVH